jgi:NADPH-dependent ferric siderophore reductase
MKPTPDYTSQRVRHELRLRTLNVARTERIASDIVRITLTGDDLEGFVSSGFDDHVKVFLPHPGDNIVRLPDLNDLKKRSDNPAERPIARDYTPRRHDPHTRELDIEFVLHGDGPGSNWAEQAKPGDVLNIAGPRGSFVISPDFDWYLLIGDSTAIPAMGRRIDELPADSIALVVVEVDSVEGLPVWPQRPNVRVHPVYRDGTPATLLQAVREAALPEGVGHVWVAAESASAKAIRAHLVEERGVDKRHIRASSYWRQGAIGYHDSIED